MRRVLLAGVVAVLALPGGTEVPLFGEEVDRADARKRLRPAKARLAPFESCDALIAHADQQATRVYGPDYRPDDTVGPVTPVAGDGAGGPGATKEKQSAAALPGDSSGTNVQEAGVDEPDIVKSDGSAVFAVSGGALHAVDARSALPRLLGSLPLEGFGHQLLLTGDRLLVISRNYESPSSVDPNAPDDPPPPGTPTPPGPTYQPTSPTTLLNEIDVSNPAVMQVVRSQRVDGDFVNARLVGDVARVVITSYPAALTYRPSKLRSSLAGWVPFSTFEDSRLGTRRVEPLLDPCAEVARPAAFSGLDLLSVLTVDLERGLPAIDADAVMASGETVYASQTGLYVATERWSGRGTSSTAIHKFDTSTPGETSYRASGLVHGSLLNQFSMSEHEGFLRAATTGEGIGPNTPRLEIESFVTVLEERGGVLVPVGRIGGLGRGEEIYAVRMIGDIGYVVTFRTIDPLFTLDLGDPANPRLLGELKIRGYSAYLHPVGEDRLIGIGQDADEEGFTLGTQISLFDISNLANPVRLEQRTFAGARSEVEFDHHAFLYWPPTRLALLPLTGGSGKNRFRGAAGFELTGSRISEVGRVAHPPPRRRPAIRRSLVVANRLLTLSCRGIEVSGLTTLEPLAWVGFPSPARRCR